MLGFRRMLRRDVRRCKKDYNTPGTSEAPHRRGFFYREKAGWKKMAIFTRPASLTTGENEIPTR